MKRIISLCCVCLTLLMTLAIPAKATEFTNDSNWIELLDYGTVNNSGENGFTINGSGTITLELPASLPIGYVEILFYSNRTISSVICGRAPWGSGMTITKVSNTYYRAYVSLPGTARSWTLPFSFTSAESGVDTRITLVSAKMSTVNLTPQNINGQCDIFAGDFVDTIYYNPSDDINYRIFDAPDDINELGFICYITVPDWKVFDCIDLQFLFSCFSINSITASIGSTNLPLTVSRYSSSNLGNNNHFISMRLDCAGIDRTTNDFPMITVMGNLNPGTTNSIDFANCSAFVIADTFEPDIFFLQRIYNFLSESWYEIYDWISEQTSILQQEFWDTVTSISMEFTNLKSNIDLNFSNLVSSIADWFSSLETQLETVTTRIVEAIRGESVHGENFQEQVQNREDDLDDMAAVMDSVTKPDIDDIDVSIDSFVDPADVAVLATPLTVFLEADLFRTMIIMSILLATVSYTLYGKR